MISLPKILEPRVTFDKLGRPVAPLDTLAEFPDNPRNADDFDPDKSPAFRDLVNSIDQVGVREAIFVYPDNGKLQMKNGHRRKRAVELINSRRQKAFEDRIALGDATADARPPELELIPGLPFVLEEEPASEFDREADMWLSEASRQKWPVNKLVPFYKRTYDSAPVEARSDVNYLAGRLGLPISRIRLLNSIVSSPALYDAATDGSDAFLPMAGREKTLRSVHRDANILSAFRPQVVRKATGEYNLDENTKEKLRSQLLKKASELHHVHKVPAGVTLERIGPKLKEPTLYNDDELVGWLTGPGTIAEDVMPATVGSAKAKAAKGAADAEDDRLLAVATAYAERGVKSLGTDELTELIGELTQAADKIDGLLADAKAARRSRVG